MRPEPSSFNKSASSNPARFVKPAKIVNPNSSSARAKHQANGDSQPVIKIALPDADTYINIYIYTVDMRNDKRYLLLCVINNNFNNYILYKRCCSWSV